MKNLGACKLSTSGSECNYAFYTSYSIVNLGGVERLTFRQSAAFHPKGWKGSPIPHLSTECLDQDSSPMPDADLPLHSAPHPLRPRHGFPRSNLTWIRGGSVRGLLVAPSLPSDASEINAKDGGGRWASCFSWYISSCTVHNRSRGYEFVRPCCWLLEGVHNDAPIVYSECHET